MQMVQLALWSLQTLHFERSVGLPARGALDLAQTNGEGYISCQDPASPSLLQAEIRQVKSLVGKSMISAVMGKGKPAARGCVVFEVSSMTTVYLKAGHDE
jgi:hypothetical protein